MTLEPNLTATDRDGLYGFEDAAARSEGLVIAFTDRRGGESPAPFDSLNLALTVGDEPARVERNRRRAAEAFSLPSLMALARQVHGAELIEVPGGCSGVVGEADVLATSARGQVISILTADCTPVVVQGTRGVAIAHAGWRGLVAGAIERAVEWVGEPRGAWVGPCIRACSYEVGPDVIDAFSSRDLPIADGSHVDPRDASLHVLARCGIDNAAYTDVCTFCDANFFSYRRDGVTGRQGAFAALL